MLSCLHADVPASYTPCILDSPLYAATQPKPILAEEEEEDEEQGGGQ